jgi:hypothetical protein
MNAKQRRQDKRKRLRLATELNDAMIELLERIKSGEISIDYALEQSHEVKKILLECV